MVWEQPAARRECSTRQDRRVVAGVAVSRRKQSEEDDEVNPAAVAMLSTVGTTGVIAPDATSPASAVAAAVTLPTETSTRGPGNRDLTNPGRLRDRPHVVEFGANRHGRQEQRKELRGSPSRPSGR